MGLIRNIGGVIKHAKQTIGNAVSTARRKASQIISGVTGRVRRMAGRTRQKLGDMINHAKQIISKLKKTMGNIDFKRIARRAERAVSGAIGRAKRTLRNLIKDAKKRVSGILSRIPSPSQLKNRAIGMLRPAIRKARRSIRGLVKDAKSLIKHGKKKLREMIDPAFDLLTEPVNTLGDWAEQLKYKTPPDEINVTGLPEGANEELAKTLGWMYYQYASRR